MKRRKQLETLIRCIQKDRGVSDQINEVVILIARSRACLIYAYSERLGRYERTLVTEETLLFSLDGSEDSHYAFLNDIAEYCGGRATVISS